MSPRPLRVVCAHSLVASIVMAGVVWMMAAERVGAMTADGHGGQAATRATPTTAIRAISMAASGPAVVVTIEATGALPVPTSEIIDGPPRIFLDFAGVALKAPARTTSTDPRVRRIRAAVHSATPLVTRVVLDLVARQPYRIERAEGRVSVIVGGSASQPVAQIAPVPPLPERRPTALVTPEPIVGAAETPREPVRSMTTKPPTPAPTPAPSAAPPVAPAPAPAPPRTSPSALPPMAPAQPLPPKDLEKYRRQVSSALDRLRLQQPLLASLDGAENPTMVMQQTVDRVQLAVEEFERLRSDLTAIKPPETLRTQHDMLFQATTLALMATRLRLEAFRTSDPATLRNAASAAAGATLLLDRACADLGCPEVGR